MKNEVKNGIIIVIVVVLILALVYLTTAVFLTGEIGNNKNGDSDNNSTSEENANEDVSSLTSYDNMIIAGRIFDQEDDTYMVIIYSQKDSSDALKTAISTYDSSDHDVKLYKVNKDEAINKSVVSDTDNTMPTNSSEIKVKDNALITISNKTVSSYISDDEQIMNALK